MLAPETLPVTELIEHQSNGVVVFLNQAYYGTIIEPQQPSESITLPILTPQGPYNFRDHWLSMSAHPHLSRLYVPSRTEYKLFPDYPWKTIWVGIDLNKGGHQNVSAQEVILALYEGLAYGRLHFEDDADFETYEGRMFWMEIRGCFSDMMWIRRAVLTHIDLIKQLIDAEVIRLTEERLLLRRPLSYRPRAADFF